MLSQKQALATGFILAAVSVDAYAYLDPGTGSAIIQGLIATIATVGVTLKLYWHRIIQFFGGRRKKNKSVDDSNGN